MSHVPWLTGPSVAALGFRSPSPHALGAEATEAPQHLAG